VIGCSSKFKFHVIEISGKELKFWSKIQNLIKNSKVGQKLKLWCKIQNLVKNSKFDQKFKIWSKI